MFRTQVLGRKFVQDVGVLTVTNFVTAILNFMQGILVARWLGPELYGVAALVMSYPALIHTVFDARSSEISVKYLSEFHARNERDRVLAVCNLGYTLDFAIAFLAFLVVLATAPWAVRNITHRADTVGLVIICASALLPQSLVGTSWATLVALRRFSLIACVTVLSTVVRTALVLALVLTGWQVKGVIWGTSASTAVTALLYGVIAWKVTHRTWGTFPLRGGWQTLQEYRPEILRFLVYNEINTLLGLVPKQMDLILIGYFRNAMEAGYYKLAKSLASIVGYLVDPLQGVIYPDLMQQWTLGGIKGLRSRVCKLAFHVGLPLALLLLVSIPLTSTVLTWLLGTAYLPAISATRLLLIGMSFWLGFFWLRPLYYSTGRVKVWTIGTGIYVFCFSILAFPIIKLHGYIGLASVDALLTMMFHITLGVIALMLLLKNKMSKHCP
jgi:O-antigen/teichoic acid export membrane protein